MGRDPSHGIFIRRDGNYALFKYSYECDFSDPIVQEARGIILDVEKLEVACWPFRKFGNYNESYADKIDWATACVQEKVDGSIVKLWFDERKKDWEFSTNGMIRAGEASVGEEEKENFLDLIRSAVNYGKIPFESLDHEKTYLFELVSPKTRIVVPYNETMLYHIGTKNRLTGRETEEELGIRKPKKYPLHSLEECIRAAAALNSTREESGEVEQEGVVVVDSRWNRVKIKPPDYLAAHYISPTRMTKENILAFSKEITVKKKLLYEKHRQQISRLWRRGRFESCKGSGNPLVKGL